MRLDAASGSTVDADSGLIGGSSCMHVCTCARVRMGRTCSCDRETSGAAAATVGAAGGAAALAGGAAAVAGGAAAVAGAGSVADGGGGGTSCMCMLGACLRASKQPRQMVHVVRGGKWPVCCEMAMARCG